MPLAVLVACVLLLLVPGLVAAQTLDGGADWGYGRSTYNTSGDQTTNESFIQAYTLGYRSVLWDPRFLTYTGELTFNRNTLTFGPEEGKSQQTGFKASASLFPTRPFRGSLHASRGFGDQSGNLPDSTSARSGLALEPGAAPELRIERTEFGGNWQIASPSLPRIDVSYQESAATVAAGSLEALQRQNMLQAVVAHEGSHLSNTLRYQRNGFDNTASQAFRQSLSDLGYEFVARASDRTWGTVRAGRRTTYSLFDAPPQFTDIGVDGYHPPPGGEVDLYYAQATLSHQAKARGLSGDLNIGFDNERSESGRTAARLGSATARYQPFTGFTVHGTGTYGERGQEMNGARVRVLTRGVVSGAEYTVMTHVVRATAGYEGGRGWNVSDLGVEGTSRMQRGRFDAASDLLHIVQLSAGYERGQSRDDLLPFGNQWQERTHGAARTVLAPRIMIELTAEAAAIDRGVLPQIFRTRYRQEAATASYDLSRQRHLAFTVGRFANRATGGDDTNRYVGFAFNGTLIGQFHMTLTARREHTLSSASRLEQDGYYTIGVIDYRVRLFTFSVEHRYTDLSLSTAARIDPLTFTGNQILFRVGRRFGSAR